MLLLPLTLISRAKIQKKNILAGNIMGFCCLKMFILPLIALFCLVYFASGVIHKDLFA